MRPFRRSVVSTLEGAGFASGPWHIRCGHGGKLEEPAMHLPEREQIRSAMEQAAARREHRLQWLDGSAMGIAVAVTVAWGAFLFFWAPYRIIRWLIGAAP
jgi:hypothetical protein